jgi:signal transduction histidine kinase
VDEVRRILDNLRPPTQDALGLVDTLRAHTPDNADGLAVQVTADVGLPPLDPDVETAAYRIALEALTNVHRHARATHCTIRLTADDSQLLLEVHDDGHGLPATPRVGVGLASMRHRAESLGGALDVRSGSDGTTVTARLPKHRP